MSFKLKNFLWRAFLCLSLGNLISYVFFHVSYTLGTYYLIDYEELALAAETLRGYVSLAWEFALPALGGAAVLLAYSFHGFGTAALTTLILSLCRLFYCLPYYYIYFISLGYDTGESIPFALGVTLLMMLATAAVFALTALFGGLTVKLLCRKRAIWDVRDAIVETLGDGGLLNLHSESVAAVFAIVLTRLAVYFIRAVVNAVSFLKEYGFGFTPAELLTMLADLLFPILLCALLYPLLVRLKKKYALRRYYE